MSTIAVVKRPLGEVKEDTSMIKRLINNSSISSINNNINSKTFEKAVKVIIDKEGQNRCFHNAKTWAATKKKGLWGNGKGKDGEIDRAVFQGAKGEEAVGSFLQLSRLDESTDQPKFYDFTHPDNGKLIEVKTATPSEQYANTLVKVQRLKGGIMTWEHEDDPNSKQGLACDYYVFCMASDNVNDWNVSIIGWITRDEILKNYGRLYNGKKYNKDGNIEWKNYQISYAALHSMDTFKQVGKTIKQ